MNTQFFNRDQQLLRLNTLVQRVLDGYLSSGAAFRLHSDGNNAVYHVTAGVEEYALRVHRPGLKKLEWIESELVWLNAIQHDTQLLAPVPVMITEDGLEGVDEPVILVLFEWLQGETLPIENLTLEQVRAIGAFAAQLHQHSEDFVASRPSFIRPVLDWEGLFGEDSPYNPGEGDGIFTDDQRAVMNEVAEQVRRVMDAQHENGFGLIHADLIPKNMLWRGNELAVIDFDDCAYGYSLYDLAPALLFFKPDPRYAEMKAALWEGYTSIRPLANQQDLETFVAGRYVASCRWVAGHPGMRDRAPEIIAGRIEDLKRFLNTGKL